MPWDIDHNSRILVIGDSISTVSTWYYWLETKNALDAACIALHGTPPTWFPEARGSTLSYDYVGTEATDTIPHGPITHLMVGLGVNNAVTPNMGTYESDMRAIISGRRALYPAMKVLLTVPWIAPWPVYDANMAECRAILLKIGRDTPDVHVLDWYYEATGQAQLTADGFVHPNADGKAWMCARLTPQWRVV